MTVTIDFIYLCMHGLEEEQAQFLCAQTSVTDETFSPRATSDKIIHIHCNWPTWSFLARIAFIEFLEKRQVCLQNVVHRFIPDLSFPPDHRIRCHKTVSVFLQMFLAQH
jgi:hypothetical protein